MAKYIAFRQGDLLFVKIDKLPNNVAPRKEKNNVLRQGEHGGIHYVENAEIYETKLGDIYLVNEKGEIVIKHTTNHKDLILPPGIYEMRVQREYGVGNIRD